jgi:hypothetical protein
MTTGEFHIPSSSRLIRVQVLFSKPSIRHDTYYIANELTWLLALLVRPERCTDRIIIAVLRPATIVPGDRTRPNLETKVVEKSRVLSEDAEPEFPFLAFPGTSIFLIESQKLEKFVR